MSLSKLMIINKLRLFRLYGNLVYALRKGIVDQRKTKESRQFIGKEIMVL